MQHLMDADDVDAAVVAAAECVWRNPWPA